MKFSYDESYLPLKKNLTGTLAAQDSAGRAMRSTARPMIPAVRSRSAAKQTGI